VPSAPRDAGRAHRPHPASWPAFPTSAARSRSAARPPPGCELRLHPGAEVSLLDGAVLDCRPGRRPREENHDARDSRQRDHELISATIIAGEHALVVVAAGRPVSITPSVLSLPSGIVSPGCQIRDCGSEHRWVGGCPVLAFELVGKGAYSGSPLLLVGWEPDGRTEPIRTWGRRLQTHSFEGGEAESSDLRS
jgi:hypothetical protein